MKGKFLFLFISIHLIVQLVCAQQLICLPKIPEAGKSVHLEYSPNEIINEPQLFAYVYIINDEEPKIIDGILNQKGKKYKGKIKLPPNTKALYVYICHDKFFDNNFQQGYSFITRGNEAKGNILLLGEKIRNIQRWSPNTFIPHLDETVPRYKELYQSQWSVAEWLAYYDVRNYYDENFELEERESVLNALLSTTIHPYHASLLKSRYNEIGENKHNKFLDTLMGNYNTNKSPWEIQITRSVNQAYPSYKKLNAFYNYYDTLSSKNEKKTFIQELASYIIEGYIDEKKFDSTLQLLLFLNEHQLNIKYGKEIVFNSSQNFGDKIYKNTILSKYIESISTADIDRSIYEDTIQISQKRNAQMGFQSFLKATYFLARGEDLDALEIYEQLFQQKDLNLKYYISDFLPLLIKHEKYALLEKVWESTFSHKLESEKLNQIIQDLAAKNKLSFQNYEEKLNEINEGLVLEQANIIAKKLSKIPAPNFQLVDINGNTVSLNNFKGKKIMIDFWATWCVFCKASFPELQKIENYFKEKDTTIQFLYIQTMEKGNKEIKRKEGFDYLQKNNLDFFNLFDNHDSLYSKKFYLNSLPTKIFIDPQGNFVYKSVGYSSGYDKNLAEFKAIFDAMK